MTKLLFMKIGEAYAKSKSKSHDLAKAIWGYKHPGEAVDTSDREYISWVNSLPIFLECAHDAKLDDVIVVFEMKTPISNKAIDVTLIGQNSNGENVILIVELKQWKNISTRYVYDPNKVYVPGAIEPKKRHPLHQLNLYENNLDNHHSGIDAARNIGEVIKIEKITYLHNFENKDTLYTDKYSKWSAGKDLIYGKYDRGALIKTLGDCFKNSEETDLLAILKDYTAIMGDEGLAGLRRAYENEATLTMQNDQQMITNFVIEHLKNQLERPKREIIVISGGPGTGKTIVGIRFILEYVNLFNHGKNDNKVMFCLPKSQTVKAMFDAACAVDEENEKEYCCYLQEISKDQNLVVVDEYDIIGLSREAA